MSNITLSADQQAALTKFKKFMSSTTETEMALEGHAGTGKTFLTKEMLNYLEKSSNKISKMLTKQKIDNIYLTATTHQAARVLQNLAGNSYKTQTIHSLLCLFPKMDYSTGKTSLSQRGKSIQSNLQDSLIIIDEASMVDDNLLNWVRIFSKKYNIKVLYILDPYQLTAVEAKECIVSKKVNNKAILNHIYRQVGGNTSPIAQLAEQYRKVIDGYNFPSIQNNDPSILRVDRATYLSMVEQEFDSIDHDSAKAKILNWTNTSVNTSNQYIRKLHTNSKLPIVGEHVLVNQAIFSRSLAHSSKIIANTNEIVEIYDMSLETKNIHGVPCYLVDINKTQNVYLPHDHKDVARVLYKEKIKAKKYKNWTRYYYLKNIFADLRPVFSSTVHKSQGSTHKKVFINLNDIGKNREPHEVARLMYVAITRATDQVIFYGNLGARYGD